VRPLSIVTPFSVRVDEQPLKTVARTTVIIKSAMGFLIFCII
jgi:hypothetical protein